MSKTVSSELNVKDAGLTVGRYFTKPGVHPFDEIEWESREARIGSGDNVIFEQRDVEFPKSWSQNATNIVTQKYFRGQLGKPERESSVKQMIGRVAGTISAWGRQGGYFTSDEAADSFEAELTHILVHQKAAFNSPVWFNVGFEETPQASACFILSVDDTMESILDWNTQEGMIFRGGSGSGINLSNIRGSHEPLSKGGSASGPVSFMRGADAWAGTIKCLAEGTEVMTETGISAIEDVRDGDRVLTRFGPKTVSAVHSNGVKPLVKVKTELGNEIVCTAEHRFLVREPSGETVWREAGDIGSDDFLVLDLGQTEFGALQRLEPVGRGHHNERDLLLPQVLHESFARWLGWIYGDGNVTDRPYARYIGVQVADEDGDLDEKYRHLVAKVFGDDAHIFVSSRQEKPDASKSLRFASTGAVRFLKVNDLVKGKAHELRIPDKIKSSPSNVRAAFVSGLFEADGSVVSGYPTLATVSKEFAVDVHRLLLTLGLPSKVRRVDDRSGAYGWRPLYTVRIVSLAGIARFQQFVGFISERKRRKLERAVARKIGSPYETDWALPHATAGLNDLWREGDSRLRRALAPYCRYAESRSFSGLRATALLNEFPELSDTVVEEASSTYAYYTRASVEPAGAGPVHDLTVEDTHEYLVHNAVTHNSGGKTRRAAKMVVLNVDHPDIREFVWCKAKEEDKAQALADSGFDMSIDGEGFHSIQYQNANNSVRVTDEFMQAASEGKEWQTIARKTGEAVETFDAKELLNDIAEAAWRCADPGMQYDTTINRWHTVPNSGRINASNPCFPGDARVHTTLGLIPFEELYERTQAGEKFRVYTHRATADEPGEGVVASTPIAVMKSGVKSILRSRFANGQDLRCTPNHRLWTTNRGYVRADELTASDRVLLNDSPTPAEDASWELPVKVEALARSCARGGTVTYQELPNRWSEGLGELMGHLVGDGWITDVQTGWVYGGDDLEDGLADSHQGLIEEVVGGVSRHEMDNGTVQLRVGSEAVREFFHGLGVSSARAPRKRVPSSVFVAPTGVQAAFLRGLFGADGCVSRVEAGGKANRYVGLGSRSEALLKDAQRILTSFGIRGRIYRITEGRSGTFSYTRKDGQTVEYAAREGFDLRISGSDLERFAKSIGFSTPRKQAALDSMIGETSRYRTKPGARLLSRADDGQEYVYNLTEPLHHSYIVDGLVVANCSEYMSIDDSACNLASLNLMKFMDADGNFDVESFEHAIDVVFLAQEILVGFSSYPTEKITKNANSFRQLGLGYANLGALLMSRGLPYDSDEGRSLAAAITALMTGRGYRKSAEIAAAIGPFERYRDNAEPMLNVMRMHRDAAHEVSGIAPKFAAAEVGEEFAQIAAAGEHSWDDVVQFGAEHGFRNAQATVLAPTGCLVGNSLVATSRGLVRLRSLGDTVGSQWQDLDVDVATDEGPRAATKFFVNGFEQVVSVETSRGYRIQGTPNHRIKVVNSEGDSVWRRLAEIEKGDRVPLMLNGIIGEPQEVHLPPLGELYWTADFRTQVPRRMTPDLAEFVGYFMGDGSLHAKGIRLCVAEQDGDVVERLRKLGSELFGLDAHLGDQQGYTEVGFHSVPLTRWWEACDFAKYSPSADHSGKGWISHIPDAVLHSNDRDVYAAFLRGLFEADGATYSGYASWSTVCKDFSRDVQSLMLALGFVTTRKIDDTISNWGSKDRYVLRLLNVSLADRYLDEIGFMSKRKTDSLATGEHRQAARKDHVPVSRQLIDELAPENDQLRKTMLMSLARRGDVSRRSATALLERTENTKLENILDFYYDEVASKELLDDEPTFDLSVPDNVTYLANGFVSHNTISFLMDCDTTGIEPDFSLVKVKELVGGGQMRIVNRTIPDALRHLGYSESEIEQIETYTTEHSTIVGAPCLKDEHLPVFDVAVGERAISHMGHIKMMAATQPLISGAISKTINMPAETTIEEIEDAFAQGWQLGLKALAIYRDGSKTAQALRTKGSEDKKAAAEQSEARPARRRLPRERQSITHKFSIAGHEGYITAGMYEDGTLGEIFLTDIGKDGSTLRGMMNAFATSISVGLQYGVPLETFVRKFSYMRFDPEGMTHNPEIPFAKSLPDYIMRWLASRFLDADVQEELGILTDEVRAKKMAEESGNVAPTNGGNGSGNGATTAESPKVTAKPAAAALTQTPPVIPAKTQGLDLGPACPQCGGMMQRTGSCYTCQSCGSNTGCG